MAAIHQFDAVMLGTGEAGKYLAWHLGASGKGVACLPSKNVVHSAKVASYFRRSEEFGITKRDWSISMSGVRDRKRKMVDDLQKNHLANFAKSGVETIMGIGRFVDEKTFEVSLNAGGTRVVRGERIFLDMERGLLWTRLPACVRRIH